MNKFYVIAYREQCMEDSYKREISEVAESPEDAVRKWIPTKPYATIEEEEAITFAIDEGGNVKFDECEAIDLEDEFSIWDGDHKIYSEIHVSGPYVQCPCCSGIGRVALTGAGSATAAEA